MLQKEYMKRLHFVFFFLLTLACWMNIYAQQAPIRVACVGNSITEGYGLGDSTYPAALQRILGPAYEVRNYGLGGRTLLKSGDHPYWKEPAFQEVQQWNPQIVIIELGTNDSKPWNWKDSLHFKTDYLEFVEVFKRLPAHPQIYLCLPPPSFSDKFGIRNQVIKAQEIPIIKQVARLEHVHVINLYKGMKHEAAHFYDGIHPDKVGAVHMAVYIARQLKLPHAQPQ